jgi:hypothetical protein
VRSLAAALAFALLSASGAAAHRLAPSYLELQEESDGAFAVLWRTPRVVARGARVSPQLPCDSRGAPQAAEEPAALVLRWRIACAGGLVGRELRVDGLSGSGSDALLRIAFADGRELSAALTAARPAFRVPARAGAPAVAGAYLRLGVEHLVSGLDHVLFVLGLVALLRAGRRLVLAISAFTLGHSVTLAAVSLGLVSVPSTPVEIGIASSLVALALALARPDAGAGSGLVRRPALLPFAFGLLHGLGFAGALAATGLPAHALPLALLSFNLGIELGQLALVALALPALAVLRRMPLPRPALVCELPATSLGALGVYLVLERTFTWFTFLAGDIL